MFCTLNSTHASDELVVVRCGQHGLCAADVVDLIEAFSRIFGVRKACADDSRDQPAAHMSLHTCSTHTMPFNGVGRGQVDKKHISESNMKLDVNDRTENVPAWPEYERVPAEVRAFVNTACEELEMRILPAVHSIHPPAKPEHIVSLLCGMSFAQYGIWHVTHVSESTLHPAMCSHGLGLSIQFLLCP